MTAEKLDKWAAVTSALLKNANKGYRAEELKDYSDFFVDPIGLDQIGSNVNSLLFGRRGSGKTLVTGALQDRISNGWLGPNVVAFRYTADDFRASPQFSKPNPSIKQETTAYFNMFLTLLSVDLFKFAELRLFDQTRWRYTPKGMGIADKRAQLLNVLIEVEAVARLGIDSLTPSQMDESVTSALLDESNESESLSTNAGLSAALSSELGLSAELSTAYRAELRRGASTKKEQKLTISRRFAPGHIRQLLVKAIQLLELDHLVIIIDEWITLSECQAEFAERLRRTFFGTDVVGVVIAADQYQCQFSNSLPGQKFRGLEINADIFVAADLDRPFRDPAKGPELFAQALYRRLLKFEPALWEQFGPPPLDAQNRRAFVDTIFASDRAFQELCIASNGLCRDFYVIFKICSKFVDFSVERTRRIDFEVVRQAIAENHRATLKSVLGSVDARTVLFQLVMPHLRRTGVRFFLVRNAVGGVNHPTIRDLLAKRFIHVVPPDLVHYSVSADYAALELDYGMYVDMLRAVEYGGPAPSPDQVLVTINTITGAKATAYELNLQDMRGDIFSNLVNCPRCQTVFSSSDRHYELKQMCPNCLEVIGPRTEGQHA